MTKGKTAFFRWQKMGVLAIEMEAAALYMNAALTGKEGLAVYHRFRLSVDRRKASSSEERQTSFTQMMEIALQTAIRL